MTLLTSSPPRHPRTSATRWTPCFKHGRPPSVRRISYCCIFSSLGSCWRICILLYDMLFCYDHANQWKWISVLMRRKFDSYSGCRGTTAGCDIQVSLYSRLSGVWVLAASNVQVREVKGNRLIWIQIYRTICAKRRRPSSRLALARGLLQDLRRVLHELRRVLALETTSPTN